MRRVPCAGGESETLANEERAFAMNEQYAALITGLKLFKDYTTHGAQRLLEFGEVKQHASGASLFNEGDPPVFVLLVLTGKLEVFVQRKGRDLVLNDEGPGSILGELSVLCDMPRSASVRVVEAATVLRWEAADFRLMLLRDSSLSARIFQESLRTLIEKEQSLIASLTEAEDTRNKSAGSR
jgi:CRP-like cAMP-binding protein